MKLIASKKYQGVYHQELKSNDVSYIIRYKSNGKLKTVKIGNKSQGISEAYCYQKRSEYLHMEKLGELPPPLRKKDNTLIFDDLANRYFADKEHKIKSVKEFKGMYEYRLQVELGLKPVDQIDKSTIEGIQEKFIKGNSIAPKTINKYIDLVRQIFNYAIEKELHKGKNPASKIEKLKIDNQRTKFLDKTEIQKLKESVKNDDVLNLFVNLSLSTGGRLETILAIKKKDINLSNHQINLTDFKNGSHYIGFINNSLKAILKPLVKKLTNSNDFKQ